MVERAVNAKDIESARRTLQGAKLKKDGSITAVFERNGKGKVTYSHRQHTVAETRELDNSVKPVRLVLTKVSQLLHKYDLTQ